MLKSRKDAAVMFWVGVVIGIVLSTDGGFVGLLVGGLWAGVAGVQWALFVNRDMQRQKV